MRFIKKKEELLGQDICKGKEMNNDDLLNIDNKDKKNLRQILIYVAVGFLIFVIVIIAIALYQNSSSKEENAILPPQINEQKTKLFKEVPIEKNEVKSEKIKKETNNSMNLIKPKCEQKIPNTVLEKNVTSKNVALTMKTVEKEKVEIKQKPKKHQQKKVFKTKYYIQVAALLKHSKPSKNFLQLIKKYGYKYTFYTTYIKKNKEKIKVTKILIGPFKNKKEALNNLSKIKKYITSNAFIYKVSK